MYYQVAGSGDAVLLIHGNAGDHRHWNNQFEYLASRYRVIRYDVRGYGKSSVPILGFPYSDYSDLAEMLDHLSVDDLFAQMGAVAEAVADGGPVAGSNAFADLVLGESIFDESADEFLRSVGSEYSWWAFANPSQTVALEPSAASQLGDLLIPVLVMTSEHDLPVCREVGDLIDSTVPSSRQVILQDTGHLMHMEMPDAFNARLLEFLDQSR